MNIEQIKAQVAEWERLDKELKYKAFEKGGAGGHALPVINLECSYGDGGNGAKQSE